MTASCKSRRSWAPSTCRLAAPSQASPTAAASSQAGRARRLRRVIHRPENVLAHVRSASEADCSSAIAAALEAFNSWRSVPAPKRGDVVRQLGDAFRRRKDDLARLISLENGKILSEAPGEVQEVIDIRDLSVGH